ncbi:hypothetical protein [Nocardia sp. 348MFTsu5.1]|uniref:hypothetical protein n=1 Tax=Nocardia sp. 348MFTsu5.1 TaxID=1172185 RepID=UPI0003A66C01|nr:hypothetical protein [Nocardia sp. 348MFTsu5.1]
MKLRKFVTAGVAVCAFLSIAACSDDSDSPATTTAATSSAATSSAAGGGLTDPSKPPTAAELNTMLQKALDPNVPASEKTDLVQDSEKDPKIFDTLVAAAAANPDLEYQIVAPVRPAGTNQAKANVKVKFPDTPEQQVEALIVFDDGTWKLSSTTVCLLLSAANETSPMCPATS